MKYGKYCEGRSGMDVKLGTDVFTICSYGVERKRKPVGNFFIGKAMGDQAYYIFLPVA